MDWGVDVVGAAVEVVDGGTGASGRQAKASDGVRNRTPWAASGAMAAASSSSVAFHAVTEKKATSGRSPGVAAWSASMASTSAGTPDSYSVVWLLRTLVPSGAQNHGGPPKFV